MKPSSTECSLGRIRYGRVEDPESTAARRTAQGTGLIRAWRGTERSPAPSACASRRRREASAVARSRVGQLAQQRRRRGDLRGYTNVIIYGVEGSEALRTVVLDWIDRVEAEDDGFLLTSELSLLECLVKPTRDGDEESVGKFGAFFDREHIVLLDAVLHDADAFLTSDGPLKKFDELPVQLLKP
jgi:hypothetical protein